MAYNSFRRSLTAGVALVGAGAIAFAAVPAPLADEVVVAAPAAFVATPRVVTTEVDPVVLATALQALATGAVASIEQSITAYGDDLPAMWDRVAANWADTEYLTLNYSLVLSSFLTPVAPLVVGPFTDAVAQVVGQAFPGAGDEVQQNIIAAVDYAFARVVGPFISAFSALGVAHLASYEAGMSGDPNARILAFLKAPFDVIDGFLFGGYGDLGPLLTGDLDGERVVPPGLLTGWGQQPVDRNFLPESDADATIALVDQVTAVPTAAEKAATVTLAVETEETSQVSEVVAEPQDVTEAVVSDDATDATEEPAASDEADATDEAAADETATEDESDEKKSSKSKLEQGAKDVSDNDSAKADDAPKSEKTEKPEKAEKADKADRPSGSDSAE
ncbi:hypothetical protein BH11ACT6_BH11ACT6_37550 [soil metagenome]